MQLSGADDLQAQQRVARAPLRRWWAVAAAGCMACAAATVQAAGGPLRIDHRLHYDDHGVWDRDVQKALIVTLVGGEIAGALWEGGETRIGHTLWQSIDASGGAVLSSELLKHVFTRERPTDTDDPDRWFEGGGNDSFPSNEVSIVTSVVTPFVLEYRRDHPAVYALELLPLYDAVARMKVQEHWQTDVLAGFALGTAWGYLAHRRDTPFLLDLLPHGFMLGFHQRF
jgi:membrane-associated phospholipid phosphatase